MAGKDPRTDVNELRRLLRNLEDRGKAERQARPRVVLEKVAAGRELILPVGPLYVIEEDAEKFLAGDDDFASAVDIFYRRGGVNRELLERLDAKFKNLTELAVERILFLDIETAGFHGSCLFLIGLLAYEEGRFKVTQLFARNYAEEAAVLHALGEFYRRSEVVVTFNGRAFDLRFIADRAVLHRVPLEQPKTDIDLLHAARRLWKGVLPNCRLGTLETLVCGRRRTGDLPSHLIPQAYHDYVESGDARLMVEVIRHNAYDLVTMAHLLAKMANG